MQHVLGVHRIMILFSIFSGEIGVFSDGSTQGLTLLKN